MIYKANGNINFTKFVEREFIIHQGLLSINVYVITFEYKRVRTWAKATDESVQPHTVIPGEL